MRVGVVSYPGACDDRDALRAVSLLGAEPVRLWHGDADLAGVDAVIIPGGFSYGDHLRPGALAALSPVMSAVREHAAAGRPVLGICNGFQVLTEARLLPGVLRPNASLKFVPANITVKPCQLVIWTVVGAVPHTVTSQSGASSRISWSVARRADGSLTAVCASPRSRERVARTTINDGPIPLITSSERTTSSMPMPLAAAVASIEVAPGAGRTRNGVPRSRRNSMTLATTTDDDTCSPR